MLMNILALFYLSTFFSVTSCNSTDNKAKTSNNIVVSEYKAENTGEAGNETKAAVIPAQSPEIDHRSFDQLLKKYVSSTGIVDYKGLKSQEAALDKYLAELGKEIPNAKWSRNASLAYWLNAYNAFTLKLILKNYPVKSIQDINGGKPWDLKWINLAGKSYTLNNIENDIIRPTYKDPRIHFALVCAAKSCPPLLNEAFIETNVDKLLDARAKNFINSSANDISASKVNLVKIFDWYQADFGNVISFLNKYASTKINPGASISYKEYDWSLNGK